MALDMSEVAALAAKIKGASGELGKDTTKALVKSTKAVERGAKQRVHVRSGETRDSIHSSTQGGRVGQVTASARQSQFEEFGTSRMAPIPFMQPALEAEEPNFKSAIEDAGLDVMRKAIGG